ncbi:MAG: cyanophycinase [Chloroflexota bacterium]
MAQSQRGSLLAIGGAEDKIEDRLILRRFVEHAGGSNALISIIPTASSISHAGERYVRIFRDLGARDADVTRIRERSDAHDQCLVQHIRESTAIFLTGGNQVRIAAVLGGTPVAAAITEANWRGAIIGGTSAGASVMTSVMVAGGENRRIPVPNMARMAPGLSLIDSLLIDQHFRERDRVARLIAMVSYNPGLLGLGIDEDTAVLIEPDDTMEVLGSGAVVVVDGSHMSSNVYSRRGEAPLDITNAVIHFLTSGSRYDISDRKAHPSSR